MKVNKYKKVTYTLEFSEEEMRWLKGVMQNPINCNIIDETEYDQKMRKAFWASMLIVDW